MEGIGLCWIWFCFSSPFAWWYIHVFIKNLWCKYLFIFFFGISDEGYNFIFCVCSYVHLLVSRSTHPLFSFVQLSNHLPIPIQYYPFTNTLGFLGVFSVFFLLDLLLVYLFFFKLSFIYHVFIDLFLNLLIHLYN